MAPDSEGGAHAEVPSTNAQDDRLTVFSMPDAPLVLSPQRFEALERVVLEGGEFALRNAALLRLFYGTGLTLSEVAGLTIDCFLDEKNQPRASFMLSADLAFNHIARPVFWGTMGPELSRSLMRYLEWRVKRYERPEELDASSVLILNDNGLPFSPSVRVKSESGKKYTSYQGLSMLMTDLHRLGGIGEGGAECARRTFTLWLASGAVCGFPMQLEWVRILRGDKRLSGTQGALKPYKLDDFEAMDRFMESRRTALERKA